ncbi:ABC transporter ATP-binding protein/permease [Halorussus gelatinilyticus]|uniref:ABC transporter ATP-binding protein/permease n=1 Tax=Halorussus gelatinilyticus TaxID=2937524 RepID=A0A8U0IIP0_9EURY|nr:ABC transporter ATP-binding protein [Halorussus gelatinilyticus]UPW00142.1 ABC transporter ATP-binding protein/permease [Halorussus gelatinilyticus]
MSTDEAIDAEYVEKHRDEVENPLIQLFLRYGEGSRRWFAVGILSSIGARFLSLVPPVVLGAAIDSILRGNQQFTLPVVPSSWLPNETPDQFWFAVVLMGVAMVGQAVLNFTRQTSLNLFSHRVKHEVRTATYQQMQRLDMEFFDEMQTGELISILSNDTNRLEQFLDSMMGEAIQLGVLMAGTAVVLLWINPQLAAVTLLVIPLSILFTYWYTRLAEERYADVRSSIGDLNSRLENNLNGIQVIKASNTEEYEDERVEDHSYKYFRLDWLALRLSFVYRPGLQALTSLAFIATFIVGGIWILEGPPGPFSGDLSVGQLVTFLLLTQRMVNPLAQMGTIVERYEDAKASTKRILGLMSLPAGVEDAPDATDLEAVRGRVRFRDVSFGYEDETVLEDVDFEVEPGETVGVVGPTGAGKTTIVKLLLRLYDVDEGEIEIDGHDVRDVTLSSLRRSMGYVGQDNFLFDGTVRENIEYGHFDADRDEVVAAAERAEAHEFITNLPEGYDTDIGERGVKLSGGQRQRVAIARTILQHPEILVFDEATSAVDTETEMLIQRSIDELAADRTTFVIAHRLSTVRDADTILVVEDGRIVQRGTHEELLAADGLYANLWRVQAGEIEQLPDEFVREASARVAREGIGSAESE